MRTRTLLTLAIVLMLGTSALIGGCSGGGTPSTDPTPTPAPTATPSPTPTPLPFRTFTPTLERLNNAGNVITMTVEYTDFLFSGTIEVNRAPDGELMDSRGTVFAPLPAGTVFDLPRTITLDGATGTRKAVFTITVPDGTPYFDSSGKRIEYGFRLGFHAVGSGYDQTNTALYSSGFGF